MLDADGYALERLLTGLRTAEGVDLTELERAVGADLAEIAPGWLDSMRKGGMLETAASGAERGPTITLRATAAGLARLDGVMLAFVRAQR